MAFSVLAFPGTTVSEQIGEFYPFGAKVTLDGETEMVMAHPGPGGENPASADVVEALVEALRVNESDHASLRRRV